MQKDRNNNRCTVLQDALEDKDNTQSIYSQQIQEVKKERDNVA